MALDRHSTIQILHSVTAGVQPTPTDLEFGELALNAGDGEIYFRKSDDSLQVIGSGGGVESINGLTGGVTLNAGTNITLTSGPSGITIDSTASGGGGGGTYSVAFIIDGNGSPITLGHKVDALRQIPVDSTLTKSEIYCQDGAVAGSGNFTINLAWVDDLEQSLSGVTGSATTINLSGVSNNLSLTPPKSGTNYYHSGTPTTPPSVTGGNWVYPIVTINASSQTKIQLFMSFVPS